MPFWKKKEKVAEGGGTRFELLGDDRDDTISDYQLEGIKILCKMEAELEMMRRGGELIEPRYYGFRAEVDEGVVAFCFEHPMEGIELMRRFAGRPTKWFRLHDEAEKADFEPFEGQGATCRFV